MGLFNFHIHISDRETNKLLHSIIHKLNIMGENLNQIKDDLAAANEKVVKIAADVAHLHDLIDNAGETPTAAEWQEVKDAAAALNTSLQSVDDATPDV